MLDNGPWFKMIRPQNFHHFQPFWFIKVSIFPRKKTFKTAVFHSPILGQLSWGEKWNQEASSRTEFVSRSLSAPKIFPKSSQNQTPGPGGCDVGGWWWPLVVDPKVWCKKTCFSQENHHFLVVFVPWPVETYWSFWMGFQLVIFTLTNQHSTYQREDFLRILKEGRFLFDFLE